MKRKPSCYRQRRMGRSDLAYVERDGHRFYLGDDRAKESRAEYRRLVTEWMATGRTTSPSTSWWIDSWSTPMCIAAKTTARTLAICGTLRESSRSSANSTGTVRPPSSAHDRSRRSCASSSSAICVGDPAKQSVERLLTRSHWLYEQGATSTRLCWCAECWVDWL